MKKLYFLGALWLGMVPSAGMMASTGPTASARMNPGVASSQQRTTGSVRAKRASDFSIMPMILQKDGKTKRLMSFSSPTNMGFDIKQNSSDDPDSKIKALCITSTCVALFSKKYVDAFSSPIFSPIPLTSATKCVVIDNLIKENNEWVKYSCAKVILNGKNVERSVHYNQGESDMSNVFRMKINEHPRTLEDLAKTNWQVLESVVDFMIHSFRDPTFVEHIANNESVSIPFEQHAESSLIRATREENSLTTDLLNFMNEGESQLLKMICILKKTVDNQNNDYSIRTPSREDINNFLAQERIRHS